MRVVFLFSFCLFVFTSCKQQRDANDKGYMPLKKIVQNMQQHTSNTVDSIIDVKYYCADELLMIDSGYKEISKTSEGILIDLKYSTEQNFMGKDLYGEISRAFLNEDALNKLVVAQKYLKEMHPNYNLLVFDAARPLKIQKMMWDSMKTTQVKYVSNPQFGSLHNYGAAVDISIADSLNRELDMGTVFDFFGELAHPDKEWKMLNEGKLTEKQVNNRRLLRKVMYKAGFFNIQTEWWHFNSCRLDNAVKKYKLIE